MASSLAHHSKAEDGNSQKRLQRLEEAWLEDDRVSVFREQQAGNVFERWEKDAIEEDAPLHLYYWSVANAVMPNLVQVALFSFTILKARMNERATIDAVGLVEELVCAALFSAPHIVQ
jgi:hypothetical protein